MSEDGLWRACGRPFNLYCRRRAGDLFAVSEIFLMNQARPDDIQYAMENTRVLHEPARRIDTFGSTKFEFLLLSEYMDEVGRVRIRKGSVEAQKPKLVAPPGYESFEFEGFSEEMAGFFEKMKERGLDPEMLRVIRYGFQMLRSEVTEESVSGSVAEIADRVVSEAVSDGNPMLGVVLGVDDAWEISIVRFMLEMMGKSQDINTFDFKRRGLL